MNAYSYHTVSSIINAFQKSVNFPFKLIANRMRFLPGVIGVKQLSIKHTQCYICLLSPGTVTAKIGGRRAL